jgi:hypothetical protein
MCFFNSAEYACLEQREPISTLKNLSCRKYSFQEVTQFLQWNNVQDALTSNIDGFFWRDSCVSSTELNSPTWEEMSLTQSTQWSNVLHLLLLTQMDFFVELHVFFQLYWLGLFGRKWTFLHSEKSYLQKVFLSKSSKFSQGNNVVYVTCSNIDSFL